MSGAFEVPSFWTFESGDVATAFDQHVREQLPWYDMATAGIAQIGRHYIGAGSLVYDVGASNGNVGRALADTLTERDASLVAIEASRAMAETYRAPGRVVVAKVESFDFEPFDFAVCMLSLMFLSPQEQTRTMIRLLRRLNPGGAVVVVERMVPPAGYFGVVTSRLTLAAKLAAGAKPRNILAKELALAGVQRPVDPGLLTDLGAVEWFRFGDFAGHIVEKTRNA